MRESGRSGVAQEKQVARGGKCVAQESACLYERSVEMSALVSRL